MVDVVALKPSALAVLDALGTYRFMTVPQLVTVGAGKTPPALYTVLKELTTKPRATVGKLDFGVLPGHGRLANVFHLTARGAEVLADSGRASETIAAPKRVRFFAQDYFHRIQCVDLHIALTLAAGDAGIAVTDYATYYAHGTKTSPETFAARTTVKWLGGQLTADAVCMLQGRDDLTRLCFLELHRGDDLRRIKSQFRTYVVAIQNEALELTFDYPHAARVLFVFEQSGTLDRFLSWVASERLDADTAGRFFLTDAEGFSKEPFACWHRLGPKHANGAQLFADRP